LNYDGLFGKTYAKENKSSECLKGKKKHYNCLDINGKIILEWSLKYRILEGVDSSHLAENIEE
jgi:hypothetical protein